MDTQGLGGATEQQTTRQARQQATNPARPSKHSSINKQPRDTDAICSADSPRHRIRSHSASAVHAQTVSEPCNLPPVRRDAYQGAMANMHRGRLCTVSDPAKKIVLQLTTVADNSRVQAPGP